jgi:hypothetical protein
MPSGLHPLKRPTGPSRPGPGVRPSPTKATHWSITSRHATHCSQGAADPARRVCNVGCRPSTAGSAPSRPRVCKVVYQLCPLQLRRGASGLDPLKPCTVAPRRSADSRPVPSGLRPLRAPAVALGPSPGGHQGGVSALHRGSAKWYSHPTPVPLPASAPTASTASTALIPRSRPARAPPSARRGGVLLPTLGPVAVPRGGGKAAAMSA